MSILIAVAALAVAQTNTAAPVDHSQHSRPQHRQHQHAHGQHAHGQHAHGQHAHDSGEHKCCKEVDGKMQCQMMKGHGAQHQGQGAQQGQQGHGTNHRYAVIEGAVGNGGAYSRR